MRFLLSAVLVAVATAGASPLHANEAVKIDAGAKGDAFPHFWAGTGMAYVNPDLKKWWEDTIMIAGIPHEDTLIRCHNNFSFTEIVAFDGKKMTLGFRRHDAWLDHMVQFCGLPQVYEFMGGPGPVERNPLYTRAEVLEIRKQVTATLDTKNNPGPMYATYEQVVRRCIERYGIEEVRRWWWQDINEGFQQQQFDAAEAAVKNTDKTLIFGGDDRANGAPVHFKHYFSGLSGVTNQPPRVDYYSHHTKDTPDLVVKAMQQIIAYKERVYPDKPDLTWVNWECDREWGWIKELPHRPTAYYAAWKAAILESHTRAFLQGPKKRRIQLNFDDGFISDNWQHRTLFTIVDEQLVKKPISNVLVMFTLLGDRLLPTTGLPTDGRIGMLATARGQDQVALLVFHYDKTDQNVGGDVRTVDLSIENLPFDKGRMVHYRLDGEHNDIWSKAKGGMKGTELVQHDELPRYKNQAPSEISGGNFNARIELPRQSVSLILLAKDPGKEPPAVPKLRARSYPHSNGGKQVYLLWNDASRALLTYEVESAPAESGPWQRVNDESLWTVYSEPVAKDAKRFYRVRAVDLWSRPGPWTQAIEAPVFTGGPMGATIEVVPQKKKP